MTLPKDWKYVEIEAVASINRRTLSSTTKPDRRFYYLEISSVNKGRVDYPEQTITFKEAPSRARRIVQKGDVLMSMVRPNLQGFAHLRSGREDIVASTGFAVITADGADSGFIYQSLYSPKVVAQLAGLLVGSGYPAINSSDVEKLMIAIPHKIPEQRKIAAILSTWDEALEKLDALITAKERHKKALMMQLLTGRKRVKGFDRSNCHTKSDRFGIYPADWTRVALGNITREVSRRNPSGDNLPVLSCTKHRGLVLSEEYFERRVYADDTSNYRMVVRGEFAYATNHIEEGSIGYQNLCVAGLVSPIYTVFRTTEEVDDAYLFRVLKSPLLIHLYRVNTSFSVDRRGSLRYDEFAAIHIWLPSKREQAAIANILDTCDEEVNILRSQRAALDQQKRGIMQRLLTGAIRVRLEKNE